jgi:YHS domain-containing protein
MTRTRTLLAWTAVALLAGCSKTHNYTAAEIAAAKDMGNTVCPVSGDPVGDSKAVAIHDGKLYHLCDDTCQHGFSEKPDHYITVMNADPKKYGLKN